MQHFTHTLRLRGFIILNCLGFTRCTSQTPNVNNSLCSVIAVVLVIGRALILTFKWQLGFSITNGNLGVLSLFAMIASFTVS